MTTIEKLKYCLIIASFTNCVQHSVDSIPISEEKDLIPEGIAVYKDNIFLSSIHKNKIVQFNLKDKRLRNFTETKEYGFQSGFGLYTKDSLLFSLTNDLHPDSLTSHLFVFNIANQKLVKIFKLNDGVKHYLNDMTINSQNQVFITDSKTCNIYKLDYPNGQLEQFLSDTALSYPNGISLSENKKRLFVASDTFGVRIINLETKEILNEKTPETTGIDGMKYYAGHLYAVRNTDKNYANHGLYAIQLSENEDKILKIDTFFKGHKTLNVPTTFDIKNGEIYLLANSQMDNLNQNSNQIINRDSLTATYILKIRLKKK
jgi:WD40 repeat protein